ARGITRHHVVLPFYQSLLLAAHRVRLSNAGAQFFDLRLELSLELLALVGEFGVEGSNIGAVRIAFRACRVELLARIGGFFFERDERAAIEPWIADLRQLVAVADVAAGKRRQRVDFTADRRRQKRYGSIDDGAVGLIGD